MSPLRALPDGPRLSPLHPEHEALGATFTDFAGWQMPLRYGSETAEHRAVREAAGLFDLSHMGEIAVTGPGAAEFLDRAVVGDLSGLTVGRARYTVLCQPDGGAVDDLVIYRLAREEFLVIANAANVAVDFAELTERTNGGSGVVGYDATVRDRSADTALIALQGPASEEILLDLVPRAVAGQVRALKYYAWTRVPVLLAGGAPADGPAPAGSASVLLARTGYTGEDGFELYVPVAEARAVWRALLAAGGPRGLVPAGLAARDSLRLEAGMPLYGHELTRELTPFDVGFGRIVKFGKPEGFIGGTALAEVAERGVPRALVGLVAEGRRVPRAGYPVLGPEGEVAGTVTSGIASPTLGAPIAMAYVDRALAEPGTELAVDIRGRHAAVRVTALPFYNRHRG